MDNAVESVLMQVEQNMGGMYGDYMGVALATAGAVAAILRPFPAFAGLLTNTAFMLSADVILFCAVALWTQGGHSIYHNQLVLLLFLASCFLRFSATWPDDASASPDNFQALVNRSVRRISEYTLLIFPGRDIMLRTYARNSAAAAVFITSFAVFVASTRTYEAFRPWRLHQNPVWLNSSSEESQLRQVLHYFRQAAGELLRSNSAGGGDSSISQSLLPTWQRRRSKRCGTPDTQRHAYDLAFLWLNGSAPLIISAISLLAAIISSMGSAAEHGFLAIWIKVLYVFALVYICWRSLPGLVACALRDIKISSRYCRCCRNVKLRSETRSRSTFTCCLLDTHLNNINQWTSDMWKFWGSSAAASRDLPTRCRSVPEWCSRMIGYVEGLELSIHIAIAFPSRLMCHGIFISFLCLGYISLSFLRFRSSVGRRKNGGKWMAELITGEGTNGTNNGSASGSDKSNEVATDVASSTVERLLMSKFTYMACRSELKLFDSMYPPEQLKGVEIKYEDERRGYAYLKGKFLELPWELECERAYMYGVVGGWVTIDDKLGEKCYEWGDTSLESVGSIVEVGHFYGGVPYSSYLGKDETHPKYSKPYEIRVWLKFSKNPVRVSHVWRDEKSLLPDCLCIPNGKDPCVKSLVVDISTYPDPSTFYITLVP